MTTPPLRSYLHTGNTQVRPGVYIVELVDPAAAASTDAAGRDTAARTSVELHPAIRDSARSGRAANRAAFERAITRVHPADLDAPGKGSRNARLSRAAQAARGELRAAFETAAGTRPRPGPTLVANPRALTLTLEHQLDVGACSVGVGAARLEHAKQHSWPCATRGNRWNDAVELWNHTTIIHRHPSWPGWATVDGSDQSRTAADMLDQITDDPEQPVWVEPHVADVADCTALHGVGIEGLAPYQADAVWTYLELGSVLCALPPGHGKTVVAATCVERDAERRGGQWRGIVVAPTATWAGWEHELDRWAPTVPHQRLVGAHDTAHWLAHSSHGVALCSPHSLSQLDCAGITGLDAIIVDEADWVVGSSKRARAAHQLRHVSSHAIALTGTPPREHGKLEHLCEWVTGEHGWFSAERPSPDPHLHYHPWFHTTATIDVVVPSVDMTVDVLDAHDTAVVWSQKLTTQLEEAVAQMSALDHELRARPTPARRRELQRLLAQRRLEISRVCANMRVGEPALGHSARVSWAADIVTRAVVHSEATLVFCDTASGAAALTHELEQRGIAVIGIDGTASTGRHRLRNARSSSTRSNKEQQMSWCCPGRCRAA